MANTEPLLTAAEVARRCNVHPETIRRWTREGRLVGVKLPGGRLRYRTEDIDALMAGDAA